MRLRVVCYCLFLLAILARPSRAQVAISLGDGRTIEARGKSYGVGSFDAGNRFQYAAVVPGLLS